MQGIHVHHFCWNELATPNLQTAKNFYGEMFGWKFIDSIVGDTIYTKVLFDEQELGGIWQIPVAEQNNISPHWLSYIYVNDILSMVEKAEKLKATIKVPITPVGDFGLFAVLTDPTGAHIAFWQSLKKAK